MCVFWLILAYLILQVWIQFTLEETSLFTATTCDSSTTFDTIVILVDTLTGVEVGVNDDYARNCLENFQSEPPQCDDLRSYIGCLEVPAGTYNLVVTGYATNEGEFGASLYAESIGQ
jgi:hypothetical protein